MSVWCCCWSRGTLNDPLIDYPAPFSYKDFQREQNVFYCDKPVTQGGYPAKGLVDVSIEIHEDEISMRLCIKPEFVKIFTLFFVESRHQWLDGMYPPYCFYRDEVDSNVFHCIHDIDDATYELQKCTRLTQRDADVVFFLTEDDVTKIREQLQQFSLRSLFCEKKRYNSFDNHLIQYPIYKVVLFTNSTGQIVMELVTHNLNEGERVRTSLLGYDMKCKTENVIPIFQHKILQHIKPKCNVGRIRIKGDLEHALHYLSTTPIDKTSSTSVRESALNRDRVQEIVDMIHEINATQQQQATESQTKSHCDSTYY